MRPRQPDGPAIGVTASWPSPAQDYEAGPVSLDRALFKRPAATFLLRVHSDALQGMGVREDDVVVVDRSLEPGPGQLLVVILDGERRIGLFETIDGRAILRTDHEEIPLTVQVQPWGVVTAVVHLLSGGM